MHMWKAVAIAVALTVGGTATAHTVLAQRTSSPPASEAAPSGDHASGGHPSGNQAPGGHDAGGHSAAGAGPGGHGSGDHGTAGRGGGHGPRKDGTSGHGAGGAHHGHHHAGMHHGGGGRGAAGQDAFAAVAEIVRILDADPATDWNTVDLERLRQHLVDMHEVVLRSAVKQTVVPDGLAMEVTGRGRTEQAIRAMVPAHATELDRMPQWSARTEPIPGGVRLTVTVAKAEDTKTLARLRGLGFIGLLTEGAHHGPHHLAMARGQMMPAHRH